MEFTTLFFDLDDTLYPSNTGLWDAIRDRMSLYMHEKLGLSWESIPSLRHDYLEKYGTTLRGLQHHFQVDAEDYLAYVHDLPLEKYLAPDAAVRKVLLSLPQEKWVFTNADSDHARRVLKVLTLEDCFQGVIDVRAVNFLSKPEKETYYKALALAGNPDPRRCILFDDSPRNLAPARAIGFTTVLLSPDAQNHQADYTISSLVEIPHALPMLWN